MNDRSITEPPTTTSGTLDVEATKLAIVDIWADVLEVDQATIDAETSDFFELGGYSLLALQAIGRVLAAHGIDQDDALELEGQLLNQLFETPTVAAQASCLVDNIGR